jgi:hypothetical protein
LPFPGSMKNGLEGNMAEGRKTRYCKEDEIPLS